MARDLRTYLANRRTRLPKPLAISVIAQKVSQVHEAGGGATVSLYFGDVRGQELYAVSLYPERSAKSRGRTLSERRLHAFLAQNMDLLADPRNTVGTWYNEDNDTTYLDVTATLPNREVAIELGRQYNQLAIYDLVRDVAIETEGDGEVITDLLPVTERLPRLIR